LALFIGRKEPGAPAYDAIRRFVAAEQAAVLNLGGLHSGDLVTMAAALGISGLTPASATRRRRVDLICLCQTGAICFGRQVLAG
jgi:hypothetical protein